MNTPTPKKIKNDPFLVQQHVDHVGDEVHEQPKKVVVDDVVTDAEGFLGMPHDT